MIEYKNGDILIEDVEAIVNTVNCVGIMGRGLALQFKNKFPQNFKEYQLACTNKEVQLGKMFVHQTGQLINPKYIINFPTKGHWKQNSKIEDISNGLDDLITIIEKYSIKSIAIPPLGSGLGGLDWKMVKKLIEEKLKNINCTIILFEPLEQKIEKSITKEIPKMTAGRAALIGLMDRYLQGLMDPFISLIEVHKLMYFMQESGEELRLKYKKAQFGPYADNLRHVLNTIEGHFISGYEDGGDAPTKQLKLIPKAVEDAKNYLTNKKNTNENFVKVAKLVDGFETPFGLELLSTVHWIVKNENASNLEEVISKIYNWNERKKQFSRKQIQIALDTLVKNDWLK
ncbi:MAG: macro domain-containing protein [Aliarcobacter skirrowii]|uniref:type II toxin-antitoxin system antitoxin DNA ADP-ribosyl glycohydrolase DarG n=1 Tax=Aliarcobacter skirrowii TaxID=28200 RepID=UPI00242B28FD|nr:macro domain-containing protein [Aliarcobacter skirrowii]MDD2509380.1 macro domain-containing protein [Aliarcobacter skirrowii]MDD3496986.1 macro domain-containing protein [Aliarcobacter skirrowii]